MDYTHGPHCSHGLFFHMVFIVAYRRPVMTDEIRLRCIEIIEQLAPNFSVELLEADGQADHLHMLLRAAPHTTISRFVNSVKTVTSRRLKKEYPHIREALWKEKFWSRSYFVASTGGATLEAVRDYIENQRR